MTFLWPGLLLLLAAVPIMIGVYVWSLRRRRTRGVRYSSLSLVHVARPGPARWRRHLPFALFAAALAALAFAVGRPVAIAAVPANQSTRARAPRSGSWRSAGSPRSSRHRRTTRPP
jgi:Ca-activated chloride channel family protein